MPLAPHPCRRIDAPRAASQWGRSLAVLSWQLTQSDECRRFLSTPRWFTLWLLSSPVAMLRQSLPALRPSQSTVDVCNDVCNDGGV